MKLLVDYHLQKLGRWLRFLGQDVEILDCQLIPSDIVAKMKSQKYVFLTRDHFWDECKDIKRTFIESDFLKEQLKQLVDGNILIIKNENIFKRCTECNDFVEKVDKEKVKEKIPPRTLAWLNDYWQCPKCKKLYWQGTHLEKIKKILEDIV